MAEKPHRYFALILLVVTRLAHAQSLVVCGSVVDTTVAALPVRPCVSRHVPGKVLTHTTSGAQEQFSLMDPAAGESDLFVRSCAAFAASKKPVHVTDSLQDIRLGSFCNCNR